jgi:hypothetical protein
MCTEDGILKGYLPGEESLIVGIRGDPMNGTGPLSWEDTKVTLQRELEDQNQSGYHLFSGAAFFPKSLIGNSQKYKFFIEPDGWEDGADHAFIIPNSDTTLHWVYYSNSSPVQVQVHVQNQQNTLIETFSLSQNYPNPFNASTTIEYSIPFQSAVQLKVYNTSGQEVKSWTGETMPAGTHTIRLNADDLPSGIYFCRIRAGDFSQLKKMILIK